METELTPAQKAYQQLKDLGFVIETQPMPMERSTKPLLIATHLTYRVGNIETDFKIESKSLDPEKLLEFANEIKPILDKHFRR